MVVRTSFSGRRGRHSAPSGTRGRPRRPHARIILAVLGACSVITGGALAGLAATGAGGDPAARGTVTAAAGGDTAGADQLNATSPARVPASPASPQGTRGGPEARRPSASPRATPAAGHLEPFGTAATSYLSGRAGTVLAAVYDIGTGRTWDLGHGGPQAEASVVKLDILETLLAERGQGSSIGLSAGDRSLAKQMIEDSDNDAATSLWYAAGGPAKIGSFNARAGLTHTVPSSCVACPGFAWPGWGLTTTTPDDQIALLKQLVTPGSLLNRADRDYALSLMENVTPSQRWGVSGGVPASVTVALKNGWLPLPGSARDWQVNSVGWIRGGGRSYLMAVLSTGNPSEQYGIDTIDRLAAMAWRGMR
jgi:beta-lactamase family protein